MSNEIQQLGAEVKEYRLQLDTVQSGLQADPDNAELQNLQSELQEVIALTESAIAELQPASQAASLKAPSPPSPPREKWSKENHPAFQAAYRKPAIPPTSPTEDPHTPTVYAVGDTVLAKWTSGDNSFYPARISSITGSSISPVYIVTFKSYATTETLSARDIKPVSNDSKKRKADGSTAAPLASPQSNTPTVISAAADINPDFAGQTKREPSKVSDGPVRPAKAPRKVKANKELEAGKNKWQDFASKSKVSKGAKKDSMFRTPTGVHGRVGFTGSGQAMRKDPARTRHIYQPNGEEE